MVEELIRIENGLVQHEGREFQIDFNISRGECIGFFTDNHMLSGAAYHGVFSGGSSIRGGRTFACGTRVGHQEMAQWIRQNCMLIGRERFERRELTAYDYVVALGPNLKHLQRDDAERWIGSARSEEIRMRMGMRFRWEDKLHTLSRLDYYRLALYKAWVVRSRIVVLDRMTEILRWKDLLEFMVCTQVIREQGGAVMLLDMDERFLFQYADRVDVMKNSRLCYRLYPEEYGEKLYEILGWDRSAGRHRDDSPAEDTGHVVMEAAGLRFQGLAPLSFVLRSGEIGFLTDDNYRTGARIRDCFLGQEGWQEGAFYLGGRRYEWPGLRRRIGEEIGLQVEMPDRPGGTLFDNLSALDNLSTCLVPKAGKRLFRRNIVENIQTVASKWFPADELQKPVGEWPLAQRLKLSYCRWYLMNPKLLICLFPFAGQESLHHEMIIEMLVMCARRGMAVWIISSGIEAVCENTENEEFLARLRYLD